MGLFLPASNRVSQHSSTPERGSAAEISIQCVVCNQRVDKGVCFYPLESSLSVIKTKNLVAARIKRARCQRLDGGTWFYDCNAHQSKMHFSH